MRRDGITKVITLNLDPRSYAIFSTRPKDRARRGGLIARVGTGRGHHPFRRRRRRLMAFRNCTSVHNRSSFGKRARPLKTTFERKQGPHLTLHRETH